MTRMQLQSHPVETHWARLRLRFRRAVVGTLVAAFAVSSLNLPAIAYATLPVEEYQAGDATAEAADTAESAAPADELAATEEQPAADAENPMGGVCRGAGSRI